jgi:hypothetical protein
MSKKHRRNAQRNNLVWPIFIVGGILVVTAAFLLTRQGSSGSSSEAGTPQIVVGQQKIDYGYVKFGNDKQFTIKVTNAGVGDLRFTKKPYVEVLEGC